MKKTIVVKGMSCKHCKMRVENALLEIQGVEDAKVDLDAGNAVVTLSKEIEDSVFYEAVDEAGYDVVEII